MKLGAYRTVGVDEKGGRTKPPPHIVGVVDRLPIPKGVFYFDIGPDHEIYDCYGHNDILNYKHTTPSDNYKEVENLLLSTFRKLRSFTFIMRLALRGLVFRSFMLNM